MPDNPNLPSEPHRNAFCMSDMQSGKPPDRRELQSARQCPQIPLGSTPVNASVFGPAQIVALKPEHREIEKQSDAKHDNDICKYRGAFEKPLRVDQRCPHPSAARHHFSSECRDKPHRNGNPKSCENSRVARGKDNMQEQADAAAPERHRRPQEQAADRAGCTIGTDNDGEDTGKCDEQDFRQTLDSEPEYKDGNESDLRRGKSERDEWIKEPFDEANTCHQ